MASKSKRWRATHVAYSPQTLAKVGSLARQRGVDIGDTTLTVAKIKATRVLSKPISDTRLILLQEEYSDVLYAIRTNKGWIPWGTLYERSLHIKSLPSVFQSGTPSKLLNLYPIQSDKLFYVARIMRWDSSIKQHKVLHQAPVQARVASRAREKAIGLLCPHGLKSTDCLEITSHGRRIYWITPQNMWGNIPPTMDKHRSPYV